MKESEVSRRFINKLNMTGYQVTRVESHGTSVGIPDMFVQGHGHDLWIELKVLDKDWEYDKGYKIPWRPGQQAWASQYYRMHAYLKCTLTVIRFNNGVYVIPMDRLYQNSMCKPIPFSIDYMHELTLRYDTYEAAKTFRDQIYYVCNKFDQDGQIDWDPEVLFDMACPEQLKNFVEIDSIYDEHIYRTMHNSIVNYFAN